MAFNFPSSPTVGQIFTSGTLSWRWDGSSWVSVGVAVDTSFIAAAANTARVSANGGSTLSNKQLNFVNTATVLVSVTDPGDGNARIAFTSTATGGGGGSGTLNNFPVSVNTGSTVSANGLNFINSATVTVTITSGTNGNANISFTSVTGGTGTVTSVGTGLGLTGGPISSSGTISANVANTTVQGITKLIDVINSNDSANAATANAVKAAYDFAATKYSSTGGTISGDVTITGNLILTGGTSQLNVTNLSVNDSIILLGSNNIADVLDIGFVGHYRRGATDTHAGIIRKATDKTFYVFDNYEVEPTNNVIDITGNNFRLGNVRLGIMNANSILVLGTSVATITDVGFAYGQANAAYSQANSANSIAISAYGQANLAYAQANTANTTAVLAYGQANAAFTQANTANSIAISAYGQANLAYTQANTANSIAISAYGQANLAYTQANTANSIAISAYGQANLAFTAANNAANTVRVTANSGSAQSAVSLNFINTASVLVSLGAGSTGNANVSFSAVAGTTTVPGIVQLTDSVTSTSTTTAATPNSVKTAFDQGNAAYTQANTANTTAVAAYGQANAAFAAANNAANGARVSANSGTAFSNVSLNFVNTATVQVSVTNPVSGIANIAFTSLVTGGGGGTLNTFPVSVNTGSTVVANGINFINSATVTVTVTGGTTGNANISFTSVGGTATPGGSNTQVQFNNNGTLGASANFTYNTAPNLVSLDANLKLAGSSNLYFGGEQANNSVANSKFRVSYNASATSLDFTFLG